MPVFKGTVGTAEELLTIIKDSVSNVADMGVEAWDVMRYDTTKQELIIKGPGTKKIDGSRGTDEIYVGIKLNSVASIKYFALNGYTGYDPLLEFDEQPGYIPHSHSRIYGPPAVPLVCTSMHYWIVANGRRVVVVTRVGTRYEAMYLGLLKPYADAGQYPYPLVVGGSMTGRNYDDMKSNYDFSFVREDTDHRHFTDPGSINGHVSALRLRRHDGSWATFANKTYTHPHAVTPPPENIGDFNYCTWPYENPLLDLLPNTDDTYTLFPIILYEKQDTRARAMFGEFDGCYWVSGQIMGPEDTITIDTTKYLVIINVFRNTAGDYWALRLD